MKAVLFSIAGASTCSLMRHILTLKKTGDRNFGELINLFKTNNTIPSEMEEQFKFKLIIKEVWAGQKNEGTFLKVVIIIQV